MSDLTYIPISTLDHLYLHTTFLSWFYPIKYKFSVFGKKRNDKKNRAQ